MVHSLSRRRGQGLSLEDNSGAKAGVDARPSPGALAIALSICAMPHAVLCLVAGESMRRARDWSTVGGNKRAQ